MKKYKKFVTTITMSASLLMVACASYSSLPISTGTIINADRTQVEVVTPSVGGAAVGAAAGGVIGHQIGNGNGKKAATIAGVLLGGLSGANAASTKTMQPASLVQIRDDQTNAIYSTRLMGVWNTGMKIRYSVTDQNKIIPR